MSGPDQCPLLGIERCPLLGGSKCISSMVQLEVLQYSNSMHSVYQAQYPKLFSYIADTYYLWTHTGNKRVLQLIITKTMYRKLLPLVTKWASRLCVYSVSCWLLLGLASFPDPPSLPPFFLFFAFNIKHKVEEHWKTGPFFAVCVFLLPCIILDRTSEAYYTGHNGWGLGMRLTCVISVILFTTHIQTQVLEKFH